MNLRENRPAVEQASARIADYFHQRGLFGAELQQETGRVLGGFATLEGVAHGFRSGLRFLSADHALHRVDGRSLAGPGREGVTGAGRVRIHLVLAPCCSSSSPRWTFSVSALARHCRVDSLAVRSPRPVPYRGPKGCGPTADFSDRQHGATRTRVGTGSAEDPDGVSGTRQYH